MIKISSSIRVEGRRVEEVNLRGMDGARERGTGSERIRERAGS